MTENFSVLGKKEIALKPISYLDTCQGTNHELTWCSTCNKTHEMLAREKL